MKKVIYSLLFIFAVIITSCDDELPKANFDLYELKSLEATAGDMNVALNWEAYEQARPSEYLIIWTAGTTDVEGGEMTVEADKNSFVIEDLENDVAYTISVQPRYAGGLAGKTTVNCTPKNARYPITDLIAAAGNGRVRLSWTKPASERFTSYQITLNPGGKVITLDNPALESYVIDGLTNDQEYTFSVVASYPTGNSIPVKVFATPGMVYPILADTELVLWQPASFAYNDMYFMAGEVQSVNWNFGDGSTSMEMNPTHAFAAMGTYTVSITVTYKDNTTETGSLDVTVINYKWSSVNLNFSGLTGYVKASNPVFSPDGKTMYIPTSTPAGHLFAVDVASGEFKWVFAISKITYGGGALVGDDGTIYQCVKDKTIENVYAINPNGSKKWALKLDEAIGAFPALSADGILYCLTNKSTLYALNAADGAIIWQQELDGTVGSAVAIDKSGNIYAGTNKAIYAFSPSKDELWKVENVNVTEQGAFALSGEHLYAALKNKGGLLAVNTTSGEKEWNFNTAGGDAYFPVVDKEGSIYFTEKGSHSVFAIKPDGQKKWSKDIGAAYNLIYDGLALSADGILYVGTQKGNMLFGLNATDGNIVYEESVGQQVMAAVTIGPDRRLYCGTIGSDNVGAVKVYAVDKAPETSSWSVRGGDIQGTNRQK